MEARKTKNTQVKQKNDSILTVKNRKAGICEHMLWSWLHERELSSFANG